MNRLDITDHSKALALLTSAHSIKRNAVSIDGSSMWSFWTDSAESAMILEGSKQEANYSICHKSILITQELIRFLKNGGSPSVPVTVGTEECAITVNETTDLALVAALCAVGLFLGIRNAADGRPVFAFAIGARAMLAQIPQAGQVATSPLETPFIYAAQASRNWLAYVTQDPEKAADFLLMLKGRGTKRAIVSRALIEDKSAYREITLANGRKQAVKNTFRDTLRAHLIGI